MGRVQGLDCKTCSNLILRDVFMAREVRCVRYPGSGTGSEIVWSNVAGAYVVGRVQGFCCRTGAALVVGRVRGRLRRDSIAAWVRACLPETE